MTHLLPPQMLRLFVARAPLDYAPPLREDRDWNAPPQKRTPNRIARGRVRPLEGVAAFLERARQDVADRGEATDREESTLTHARVTQTELRHEERAKARADTQARMRATYDPKHDTHAIGDPFKTLFLSRLAYTTTERELQREFDRYGPIERVVIVRDHHGKSRGYAFVLFERERDMRKGIRIDGRRIMVDVERGRTVKDWKPTRLGGGLGGQTRRPKLKPAADLYARHSALRGRGRGAPFRGRGRPRTGFGTRDSEPGPRDPMYGARFGGSGDRGGGRNWGDRGWGPRDAHASGRPTFVRETSRDGPPSSSTRPAYQDRDGPPPASGYGRPASGYDDRYPKRARF